MLTGTELTSDERAENKGRRTNGRASAKVWIAAGVGVVAFVGAWLKYSPGASGSSAGAAPAALPQVVVSKPLVQDLDTRLGFLGQFSAVSRVELRAQVGGTLTGIFFKDGDIVRKSEEHTSELQSRLHLVCRLLLEKKKKTQLTRRLDDH